MQFALAAPITIPSAVLDTDLALEPSTSNKSSSTSKFKHSVILNHSETADARLISRNINISQAADVQDQLLTRRGGTGITSKLLNSATSMEEHKILLPDAKVVKARSGLVSFSDGAPEFIDLSAASSLGAKDRIVGPPRKGTVVPPVEVRQSPFGVHPYHRGIEESGPKVRSIKYVWWNAIKSREYEKAKELYGLGELTQDAYAKELAREVARLREGLDAGEIKARLALWRTQRKAKGSKSRAIGQLRSNHKFTLRLLERKLDEITASQELSKMYTQASAPSTPRA